MFSSTGQITATENSRSNACNLDFFYRPYPCHPIPVLPQPGGDGGRPGDRPYSQVAINITACITQTKFATSWNQKNMKDNILSYLENGPQPIRYLWNLFYKRNLNV